MHVFSFLVGLSSAVSLGKTKNVMGVTWGSCSFGAMNIPSSKNGLIRPHTLVFCLLAKRAGTVCLPDKVSVR